MGSGQGPAHLSLVRSTLAITGDGSDLPCVVEFFGETLVFIGEPHDAGRGQLELCPEISVFCCEAGRTVRRWRPSVSASLVHDPLSLVWEVPPEC